MEFLRGGSAIGNFGLGVEYVRYKTGFSVANGRAARRSNWSREEVV